MPDEVIGYFGDSWGKPLPGYNKCGECLVYQVTGDSSSGILKLIPSGGSEWGPNNPIYMRFEVISWAIGPNEDILKVEYFSTLEEAENGFTNNYLIYKRYWSSLSVMEMLSVTLWAIIGALSTIIFQKVFFNEKKLILIRVKEIMKINKFKSK